MISVILQTLCLGTTLIGYAMGADLTISMFCIGWCSAFTFNAVVKAFFHPRGHSSQGS